MYIDAQVVQIKEAINRMSGEDEWMRNTALRTRGKEGERGAKATEQLGASSLSRQGEGWGYSTKLLLGGAVSPKTRPTLNS